MNEKSLVMEALYNDYHQKVTRYISSKVFNPHDCEDLVSAVFLKMNQRLDSFDAKKASVSTWVYTVTRNTVIDFFRTNKQFDELPNTLNSPESIDEILLNDDALDALASALEQLEMRLRDIIILHYYSGFTLKAIADTMNMSYGNVKILHKKALIQLKADLEKSSVNDI